MRKRPTDHVVPTVDEELLLHGKYSTEFARGILAKKATEDWSLIQEAVEEPASAAESKKKKTRLKPRRG